MELKVEPQAKLHDASRLRLLVLAEGGTGRGVQNRIVEIHVVEGVEGFAAKLQAHISQGNWKDLATAISKLSKPAKRIAARGPTECSS